MKITKEITLDVSRLNRFQSIIAKQNDKDSRYLKVSVADEGNVLIIPSSAKVTITATRPDKLSSSFLGKISEDGKAIVPLSQWMLELDGSLSCEVSIITEESVLKTTSFYVDVEPDESSGNTDVTQDPNYDILVELIQEVAGVAAVEKEAISIAVDAYLHEKNIRPLQKGTDYWTEADKAEMTAQVKSVCVAKNQGASNVGKILVVGTDGNLTLADMPEGSSGDVVGVLDESNNILLSGNLADGTYTLKYENADGTYTEIGQLEVGAIPEPVEPVTENITLTDGIRVGSDGGDRTQAGCCATPHIDLTNIPKPCTIHLTGARWAFYDTAATGHIMYYAKKTDGSKLAGGYTNDSIGDGYFSLVRNGGGENETDVTVTVTSDEVASIRFGGVWTTVNPNTMQAKATLTYTPNA